MTAPRSSASRLLARLRRRAVREDGSMTVHGLFMFMTCCLVSAAGLDVTHMYEARSQLQVATDAAAHAALFRRNQGTTSAEAARAAAIAVAEYGTNTARTGHVLQATDIVFGTFDPVQRRFTRNDASRTAVHVTARRSDATANPVGTFLFRLAGVDEMSIVTDAVYMTYQPKCLNEGFVAQGVVDVQSNNSYYHGFCVHSNDHVEMNQNNFFESGTTVSMPDLSRLVIPNSGMTRNAGLEAALKTAFIDLKILDRVVAGASDSLQTSVRTLGTPDTPRYLTSSTPVALSTTTTTYAPAAFTAGRVHTRTCTGNQRLTFSGGTYANFVLDTNCPITFSGTVRLENAVVMTSSTASDSIKTPSGNQNGLELGRPDNCAVGNGAQIITRGGMQAAAKLEVNGGQVIALGNIQFAANATGLGASFISGGSISGTSNMSMTHCATGLEDNFKVPYFRLAG